MTKSELVLVDDGLVHGGGQIGLGRYLRQASALRRELVLLGQSRLEADAADAGVVASTLQRGTSRRGLPVAWARLIRRHLRRVPGQVVVANSLMAAIVLAATPKRGRRFVYYMREDFAPDWISGIKRTIVQFLVFPRYDGFLANSQWTASTLPPARSGPRQVSVAYPLSGVGGETQPTQPTRSRPPQASTELRVLSLSRIARWKGIDVAVDAAELLADSGQSVVLTVAGGVSAGDEDYAHALRSRAPRAGLSVGYTGHVDDVDALLATHEVLVVCSRHPEPFGQVVVQALAAGLTVVATAHGGPADILADEPLGRLVAADDAIALQRVLAEVAADPPDPADRARSAAAARARYADAALAAAFERAVETVV